jgi:muramoyltetrapeptide carboxypeptidase
MLRRNFLSTTAISALSISSVLSQPKDDKAKNVTSKASKIIKPKALRKGDTIGLISPGTAVTNPDDYAKVKEIMDYLELKYKFSRNVTKGSGYKSRSIQERVDDINEMFSDNSISGIFCIRGGYGSGQLLDSLSFELIRKNPKIFLGYSDITALHLAINKITNLVTFHGPVALSDFDEYSVNSMKSALFDIQPLETITNNSEKSGIRTDNPLRTLVPGKANGQLTGGNLTLICSLMGTRYEINTKNRILFIEDVDEEPYRIDRMLTQLKTAGKLEQASGIIFGRCNSCKPSGNQLWDFTLGEVLNNILGSMRIPSYYGLTFGHTESQITIPYGVNADMDADNCILKITESACS